MKATQGKLEKEAQQELCSRGPKAIRKAAKDMREEGRAKPALSNKSLPPPEKSSHLPPPVPLDDDEDADSAHEAPANQIAAIEQESDIFYTSERKPAAQLLFEMADAGMQFGREAEGVADDIMNEVEEGLDLQFLAFVVDVAKRLENRVVAVVMLPEGLVFQMRVFDSGHAFHSLCWWLCQVAEQQCWRVAGNQGLLQGPATSLRSRVSARASA